MGRGLYQCRECKRGEQPELYSQFLESFGGQMICARVAEVLANESTLVPMIIESFTRVAHDFIKPDAVSCEDLQRQEQAVTRKLNFIYDAPAESEVDRKEQHGRVRLLQAERFRIQRSLKILRRRRTRLPSFPRKVRFGSGSLIFKKSSVKRLAALTAALLIPFATCLAW